MKRPLQLALLTTLCLTVLSGCIFIDSLPIAGYSVLYRVEETRPSGSPPADILSISYVNAAGTTTTLPRGQFTLPWTQTINASAGQRVALSVDAAAGEGTSVAITLEATRRRDSSPLGEERQVCNQTNCPELIVERTLPQEE